MNIDIAWRFVLANLLKVLRAGLGVLCIVLGVVALVLWSDFVWAFALAGALVTAGLVMVVAPFVRRGVSREK